jgi:hypothetical protein
MNVRCRDIEAAVGGESNVTRAYARRCTRMADHA